MNDINCRTELGKRMILTIPLTDQVINNLQWLRVKMKHPSESFYVQDIF